MIFLLGEISWSYEELLNELNSKDFFYNTFVYDDLREFYVNLIFALINNSEITLVDSDISEHEKLANSIVSNQKIVVDNPKKIDILSDFFQHLKQSKSVISLYTSGTTGVPKKISHSFQNLSKNIKISENNAGKIWALAYNPTHMAGIQVFFQALLNGNSLVDVFRKSRNEVYDILDQFQVTNISATPTFYRLLLPFEKEFSFVERVSFGGEKSDQKLMESIKKIFPTAKTNNIYASTEAGAIFATQGEFFKITSSVENMVQIIDSELFIHESLVGKSNEIEIKDGFYATGDLIEWIDEEQKIFKFLSRKNEMINVGGYKINPHEVEDFLCDHFAVKNALVFGKKNSVLGNILCCDIQVNEGFTVTEDEIRNYLSAQLQDFKIPRRIKFVEEIEITRTGKKTRR